MMLGMKKIEEGLKKKRKSFNSYQMLHYKLRKKRKRIKKELSMGNLN